MSDDDLHKLALALIQPQLERWLADLGKEHEATTAAAAEPVPPQARSTAADSAELAA